LQSIAKLDSILRVHADIESLHDSLCPGAAHLNEVLATWARRKYKRLRRRRRASAHWLGRTARRNPTLFVLWELGVLPEAGS